jgi:hypothetical protein
LSYLLTLLDIYPKTTKKELQGNLSLTEVSFNADEQKEREKDGWVGKLRGAAEK